MNIKLFGYSISLNVIILIGILYLIMVVNALSGSCNREGMEVPDNREIQNKILMLEQKIAPYLRNEVPLTQQNVGELFGQLADLQTVAYATNDQDILNKTQELQSRVQQVGQIFEKQRVTIPPPITSRPKIAPSAELEPEPMIRQLPPPITSRPKIAPSAELEPEPMIRQLPPPMIEEQYIAPSAQLEPAPMIRQLPPMFKGPPMLKGPPPKLGSIMNKFKKRF